MYLYIDLNFIELCSNDINHYYKQQLSKDLNI